MMGWLSKIIPGLRKVQKQGVPDGIWVQCPACLQPLYQPDYELNKMVCPLCGNHGYWSARQRLESFFDRDTFKEIGKRVKSRDHLKFKDLKAYPDRIKQAKKVTGEQAALVAGIGLLNNIKVVACAFEFKYIGGSMDSAVGERFRLAVMSAIENNCPVVCFSASGGARMQEGVISLLQMSKVSALVGLLGQHKLPFISVLTNPTTGGVAASLAMLGDINIAEPKALIGFTGPRVIEQTIKQKLPKGFQRSEFLLEKGSIDQIVHRHDMRREITRWLKKIGHHLYD